MLQPKEENYTSFQLNPEPKKKKYALTETTSLVSHQLKTPLSAIKGYLEVLLSEDIGDINQEQKQYLSYALENANRMISLVKDLLDVSIIEEGKLSLRSEKTDMEKIVREAVEELTFLARARNSQISLKISGKIPLLNIDAAKIRGAVANLISNAIKYNKNKGMVEVFLEKKGRNVVFCCKDTGIGISEQDKKKVFNKFFRAEEAVALDATGSGLGLFISKAAIEKSGGKIWFKSQKNKGSLFCFSLPAKESFNI